MLKVASPGLCWIEKEDRPHKEYKTQPVLVPPDGAGLNEQVLDNVPTDVNLARDNHDAYEVAPEPVTAISDEIDDATPYDAEQVSTVVFKHQKDESESTIIPDQIIQHQYGTKQAHVNSRD